LRAFQDFPRRPGQDIKLDNVGYLFLLTTEEQVSAFEDSVAIQNRLGVPSRLISPAEARHLCPYVSTDGLLAAVYSPDDGHARPVLVIDGYARAAANAGVRVMTRTSVIGMDVPQVVFERFAVDRGKAPKEKLWNQYDCAISVWICRQPELLRDASRAARPLLVRPQTVRTRLDAEFVTYPGRV
jgi:hypothetical protein